MNEQRLNPSRRRLLGIAQKIGYATVSTYLAQLGFRGITEALQPAIESNVVGKMEKKRMEEYNQIIVALNFNITKSQSLHNEAKALLAKIKNIRIRSNLNDLLLEANQIKENVLQLKIEKEQKIIGLNKFINNMSTIAGKKAFSSHPNIDLQEYLKSKIIPICSQSMQLNNQTIEILEQIGEDSENKTNVKI